MPAYDSQGRLKIVNANSSGTGSIAIVVASGSSGEIVNSTTDFINFTGPAIESVFVSGSGVTVTVTTGSGGSSGGSELTVSSGSVGTIVTSSVSYLNFQGNNVVSASISGSGVSLRFSNAPRVEVLEGFTTANYYTGSGICPGSTSFSVVWYGLIRGVAAGAGQYLIGRYSTGQGWALQIGGPALSDSTYYLISYVRGTGDTTVTAEWTGARLVHYTLTYDGSTLRHYIDGNIGSITEPTTTFTPSSNPLQLGMTTVFNEPLVQGGFIGAGYIEDVLTSQQLQDHLQACKDEGYRFPSNGIAWNHYWDITNPGSNFPEVIQDLTGGTGSLGRVGTAITSTRLRGL